MKTLEYILWICFIGSVLSQTPVYNTIQADFTVTASPYNHGYFSGIMFYSWNNGASGNMLLQYPAAGQFAELYSFNGYNGWYAGLAQGQYSGQYLYKNSSVCYCETTALLYPMPALFVGTSTGTDPTSEASSAWTKSSSTQVFNNVQCTEYDSSTSPAPLFPKMWIDPITNLPCAFLHEDGRTFTLDITTMKTDVTIPADKFNPPQNCKCGKPMDIVISLDRTGSIQNWEWAIEHEFTKNVSEAFDYGPLKCNLGIINWNSVNWVTLNLADGVSSQAVETAIDAMTCCTGASGTGTGVNDSCCCCGTDIGGGIYLGANMLLNSLRPTASKILLLLTDGCQNHLYNMTTNTCTACDCSTELSCQTDTTCIADITYYYNWAINNVPGIKILVIGVGASSGASQTVCSAQLLDAAGGIQQNVYQPQSWYQLSSITQSLSATACTEDETACDNCCGLCSCGTCIVPTSCAPIDNCHTCQTDPNGGCPTQTPITCTAQDACHTASCDLTSGQCVQKSSVTCPQNSTCYSWSCNGTTGNCDSTLNVACIPPPPSVVPVAPSSSPVSVPPPPPPPPQCYNDSGCAVQSACRTGKCQSGKCVFSDVTCPTSDACTTWACNVSSTGGNPCYNTTKICNDGNACTNDTCDPKLGCQFKNNTYAPPGPCANFTCDPTVGPLYSSYACPSTPTSSNSSVNSSCFIGSCNKTTNACGWSSVCVPPPGFSGSETNFQQVLGASLGVAAVAAIIVCGVVVGVAAAGGGAFAYAQAGGAGGAAVTASNPLYVGTGASGVSPLYKPGG